MQLASTRNCPHSDAPPETFVHPQHYQHTVANDMVDRSETCAAGQSRGRAMSFTALTRRRVWSRRRCTAWSGHPPLAPASWHVLSSLLMTGRALRWCKAAASLVRDARRTHLSLDDFELFPRVPSCAPGCGLCAKPWCSTVLGRQH
jgi:hypothetical protein